MNFENRTCPVCFNEDLAKKTFIEQCGEVKRIQCLICEAIYFDRKPPENVEYDLKYNLFFNRPTDIKKAGIMACKIAEFMNANFKDQWILEVGPGNGLTTFLLQHQGFRTEAVDISSELCEHLIRKLKITCYPAKFETAKLWHGYALIYASHVLEHSEDPHLFFEKAREILIENGALWLDTPDIKEIPEDPKKWKHFRTRNIYEHCILYSAKTIRILAKNHSFKIEKIVKFKKYASMQIILRKKSNGNSNSR